jgi:hypothetical protein
MVLTTNIDRFLKQHQTVDFSIVKYGVLFEERVESLNTIYMSFGFGGINPEYRDNFQLRRVDISVTNLKQQINRI